MSYPRYSAYRDSGVEWLGEVPEHWRSLRLKHVVAEFVAGGTPESSNQEYWADGEGGFAWVSITDMTHSRYVTETLKRITWRGLEAQHLRLLPIGTILYSMYASIGEVAVLGIEATTNQAILGLLPSPTVVPSFLVYWLESIRPSLKAVSSSNTQDNLNAEKIRNLPVFLPPLEEQPDIAAFLDRETARLDALIAEQERLIALLREKRQALIAHVVTKGLDPDAPMQDSGVEWLGEIPAHWDVTRLKYVAQLESGHTPSRTVPEYWENCSIPWVSLKDVSRLSDDDYIIQTTDQVNELGLAHSSARVLPPGTVVLSRDATVGKCAILGTEMATSQHFVNWICGERLMPEYLLLVFREPMQGEFERLTMGATLRTIGMPEVNGFVVPVPPALEQRAIISHVRCETDKIDELMSRAKLQAGLLGEYRTSLIAAAVTGQIDVRAAVLAGAAP